MSHTNGTDLFGPFTDTVTFGNNGSVESADGVGIGRHNRDTEAGEYSCSEDTFSLREASSFTRSKAY